MRMADVTSFLVSLLTDWLFALAAYLALVRLDVACAVAAVRRLQRSGRAVAASPVRIVVEVLLVSAFGLACWRLWQLREPWHEIGITRQLAVGLFFAACTWWAAVLFGVNRRRFRQLETLLPNGGDGRPDWHFRPRWWVVTPRQIVAVTGPSALDVGYEIGQAVRRRIAD